MSEQVYQNTDRELWRERPGDYYADSVFVTEGGGIGFNCGGRVVVKPPREWVALGWGAGSPAPSPTLGELEDDIEVREQAVRVFWERFMRPLRALAMDYGLSLGAPAPQEDP